MAGTIVLKDNVSGQFHSYPVAWLDVDRLQALDGSLPLTTWNIDATATVQYAQATYGASVDLDYYVIGNASTPYVSGYVAPCISDVVKPSDTAADRLVDFLKHDGTRAEAGDKFTSLFFDSTYSIPPADWNTSEGYYTKQSYGGYTKYNSASATFNPSTTYSKNDYIARKFWTTTGNTFGVCAGIGGNSNTEFVCSGCRYIDITSPLYGPNAQLSPAVQDNRDPFTGGWMRYTDAGGGGFTPAYNSNPYNNSGDSPYSTHGGTQAEPVVLRQTSIQICATVINSKVYLGIACLRWSGDMVTGIYVEFFPDWFWGQFAVGPGTPESAPQFFGLDAGISGGFGTYTDTSDTPSIPSAVQPFSGVSPDGYGLHVYDISNVQYDAVQAALWGSGGVASSLWNKWLNYKFNPIASIIACHYLPSKLKPQLSPAPQEQLRAGGCCIIPGNTVDYLNSKTTVDHAFTEKSIDPFFSNHLNYSPFTHYQLFLPFCGWIDIPADRIRGGERGGSQVPGKIKVTYRCDIITGNVCAFVDCTDVDGHSVQYTATGNAALSVPITGNDNGTGAAVGAISGLALGLLTGNAAGLAAGAAGAALSISGAQHTTQQAGQYAGSIAAMGQLSVLLVATQPIQQDTERARDLRGLVSYVDATIADLEGTGYTECAEVRADVAGATDEEKAEIERILKGGVYL